MDGFGTGIAASNESRYLTAKKEDFAYKDTSIVDNLVNKDIDSMSDCAAGVDDLRQVHLDALPDEILEFILTYLPPYKDLKCCSLVCKRWNSVVKNLIRRSKINLHKGLLDYRLRWEVFSQQTAAKVASRKNTSNNLTAPLTTPPIIAGRFSHSAVRHGNSMYVFGGGSSSDTTFNDLWRFDLSEMIWERPLSMGSYPSPKGSASIVCWGEQLVLFGGWRYPSLHPPYQPWCLFDELHFYDLNSNRWTLRITLPSPPPMAGHSASVHGDRMVIFGGYQIADGVNSNSNETWCLDLNELKWWQPRFMGNTKPPPRYGQFQLLLDECHLLIVGGCGGPNSVYSDAWLLDMSQEAWLWRAIPIRNKKFGATHMWCNPACKIGSKLVVLGPTPNMPQNFQMMKQMRGNVGGFRLPGGGQIGRGGGAVEMPAPRYGAVQQQNNRNNPFDRHRLLGGDLQIGAVALNQPPLAQRLHPQQRLDNARLRGPDEQYFANRRAILQQNQHQANNIFNNNNSNNNNIQPRRGRLGDLHVNISASNVVPIEERNQNRPSCSNSVVASPSSVPTSTPSSSLSASVSCMNGISSPRNDNESNSARDVGVAVCVSGNNSNDIEAANRLQRNLALRCRDNEPLLPKRFDELFEDPFRMAAFNVQTKPRSVSKDHNERIRRMEEKMNALRNSRRSAMIGEPKAIKEPSPKRIKRNVLSLFVCDLSAAMDKEDPHLQWVEYKNYGVIPGAPERLILSTMVAGHGELILFGGVHKETLGEITHQVSNSVHFLSAPREII
ncbi:uncharacterized protein LOC118744894 [Rhagoletis pomonella]|uniref:uncharacterized protein LOC118744894 n=1 Tax=Rhagoletis pomonella TaxID=28610 RepID=UPI0017818F86|nr:uncharacterized protein LOC118744894 [Rhagoletis pomonella]XP_036334208.1 uncharacterized protein LOC118744894 [Rhagoletis pomonella]